MKRWIRKIFPYTEVLIFAAIIYLLVGFSTQLTYISYGGTGQYSDTWKVGIACLSFYAAVYGIYRVVGFHPICHADYLSWLRRTPWEYGKPLPGGPLQLISQDLVLVGLMTALAWWHRSAFALLIPAVFLGFLLLSWTISFKITKLERHAYLMAFAFSLLMPCWNSPIGLAIVFAVLYTIAVHGIRETLLTFDDWSENAKPLSQKLTDAQKKDETTLGWPYDRLAPRRPENPGSFRASLALSSLVTWWAFLAVACFWPDEPFAISLAFLGGAFFGTAVRIMIYLAGYSAPLSLRGRVLTGQWIIPGFDIVWVAPALMLLLSGSVLLAALFWPLPFSIGVAIIVFGTMMIGLECPPDLETWKLTGNHHIVKGVTLNGAELQRTQ